jgi:D-sedoheptulose 7-phosphate isomerase
MKPFQNLTELYEQITASDQRSGALDFEEAAGRALLMLKPLKDRRGQVILIGNGGSAAITSHVMTDFIRSLGIAAVTLTDESLLTCMSNDYGYGAVYEKSIEVSGRPGDVLIAISSSGKSENILRGAAAARKNKMGVITLSGFAADNPLRTMGDVNFYVPSSRYGHVEIVHLSICHHLVDCLMQEQKSNG